RLQVGPNRAELGRADVERRSRRLGHVRRTDDRVDEIFDREQLVTIVALTEDVDPPSFPNPVEEDLEHADALRTDERLRPDDRRLDRGDAAQRLRVDLGLAVPADADERIVLLDRMLFRHAVHRGGGAEDHPAPARAARRAATALRPPRGARVSGIATRLV